MVWCFYMTREGPWSGPWPDLLPCLRSDYLTRQAWLDGVKLGKSLRKSIWDAVSIMNGIWMWASQVVVTSRKLMQEHAVAASAAPALPDAFSPFAADRQLVEAGLPDGSGGGGNSSRRGRGNKRNTAGGDPTFKRAPATKSGHKFCQAWGEGGCVPWPKQCPRKELHACSIVEPTNGRICGRTGGRACEHPNHTSKSR